MTPMRPLPPCPSGPAGAVPAGAGRPERTTPVVAGAGGGAAGARAADQQAAGGQAGATAGEGETPLTIRQMCAAFGVTPRTLRFYEQKGLIAPARDGQHRLYSRRDRARLTLILRGRRFGFALDQIGELLGLYDRDDRELTQLRRTRDLARARLADMERQRADLDEAIAELRAELGWADAVLEDPAPRPATRPAPRSAADPAGPPAPDGPGALRSAPSQRPGHRP